MKLQSADFGLQIECRFDVNLRSEICNLQFMGEKRWW